ncbi:hypothetical protein [Bacillus sp. NPDC094106]|uniref:hypothetical protein n=1 Tax=Bacillus sp. NPDC094106 TaxID=3363949 RepID=UPI00381481EB
MDCFYYRINNLLDENGNPNYRGLDIDKIVAGSQVLPHHKVILKENYCILAYPEDKKTSRDLIQITKEEYNAIKINLQENRPEAVSLEQTIEQLVQSNKSLEESLLEMTNLAAEQEQRNIRNEEAIMELTTMIGGMTNV